MTRRVLPPEFAVEVAAIDTARDAASAALREANARGLTGADIDAVIDAMDQVTARCEELRRRYFPRRHRLFVACGLAVVISRTGRSTEIVWRRPDRGVNR
ncbi:hypothetical protein LTT66_16240 [Nocardia gipuzkoensis]|uniref:hypothetical protein n=1 Tax=Nocardia gipuzkoensis TaxID=2749991 RepID=UPI001E653D7D|nr:hypothetical protein [Nocardia gipuzkoensis]UGT71553.1 hypothetical protein LTT66_16240 [Nocardia gipuzkoensis]